jgi:hypothetical protein
LTMTQPTRRSAYRGLRTSTSPATSPPTASASPIVRVPPVCAGAGRQPGRHPHHPQEPRLRERSAARTGEARPGAQQNLGGGHSHHGRRLKTG